MPKRLLPRDYLAFLWEHRRLLTFGLLTAMLSGFSQTFYIGLFNPQLRASFDLGHGELGLVYGGATLASVIGGTLHRSQSPITRTRADSRGHFAISS